MEILVILSVLIILIVMTNVRVVSQSQAYVIERLGAYTQTWQVGLKFKLPVVDRVVKKISLKEQVFDFPPQPVITKDNVTMQIDTVVYYQITDPKLYTYGIENPTNAILNLTATTLRNIIGDMELDSTLTSRDIINSKMRLVLDEATDPWGIKINRVELKNIIPPREIQEAMEKQMKAERERRQSILIAEGKKKSSVLDAEGEKESEILRAEAFKESLLLRSESEKLATIQRAEGEAEAIKVVQFANAEGIIALNNAKISKDVLSLKGMETFEKVADGKATKLIIPSEIQGLVNLGSIFNETKKNNSSKS